MCRLGCPCSSHIISTCLRWARAQEGMGPDKGDQAAEDGQAQKQAPRAALGGAGGRPKGNALFNISAHLGLGGASRTSPPRTRALVSSRQANLAWHSSGISFLHHS